MFGKIKQFFRLITSFATKTQLSKLKYSRTVLPVQQIKGQLSNKKKQNRLNQCILRYNQQYKLTKNYKKIDYSPPGFEERIHQLSPSHGGVQVNL